MKGRILLVLGLAALSLVGPRTIARADDGGGNSAAAHACQQGGYLSLVGADGTTFDTVGACVSFAAQGGTFATGIIIPAGHTATLSNASFSACDPLTYGYQLDVGANVPVDSKPFGCETVPALGATVGPFPTAELLRVFLTDDLCPVTYYSDGNHALVTGTNPFLVDITDSFFCAFGPSDPRPPPGPGAGNLDVIVSIS
jgi:hypothetical protein